MESKFIKDPLLETLVMYTKLHGRPYSAEALIAGLPVEKGKPAPELFSKSGSKSLFSRAANRAGFKSKILKVELDEISPLILPCILLLKSESKDCVKACILESFDETKENAKIILPEMGEVVNEVSVETLKNEYQGLSIFLKKKLNYEEQTLDVLEKKESHWFWGTMAQVKNIYRDVILASLLINIFVLATPLFTMNVYDRVVPNAAISTMWALAIGILVIYAIDITLKFIRSHFLEVAGRKTDIIMSSILFERVMDLRISSMPKSIGSFANVLKEFESIRAFLTSSTISLLIDMPFVIIFLIAIYYIAGNIVLIPIIIMVIILLYTLAMRTKLQQRIESTYKAAGSKNGVLIESLGAIESLKTLGALGYAQWKWEEATGDIADKSIHTKFLSASISTITSFLVQLNTVMIIIAGVYMIADMSLTLGGLIATVIISTRAIAPMGQVASLLANYEHTKTAYNAIEDIMNLPVEHPDGKRFVQRPEYRGIVAFQDVWFTYPAAEKSSLEDINFKIEQGEHVGLIGKIGSGKSTIQKLILGLYHAKEGSILIDGIDIKQIDPADLRKNIAYVSQDIVLFSGTVKENLIYRAPHADDEMILKASKISGILDFVNKHPRGFDMQVGERGSMLSGGQRQSIAIARAILLDSPIVILDEPTSAMDNATEQKIITNLREYLIGKTLILVTHKSSLLKLVNRMILFEDGKKMLDGSKDEILNKLSGK
ncbi:MAG: type I secretion system permease/ATPase [Helicobacteraceae bacterium]|nr:type I secretion system permease/ATPase [Helicobacteraceae bacterium]